MDFPLYVLTRGQRLEIFGDPIGDVLVVNQRLGDWQQESARCAGLEVEFVESLEHVNPPYFVMAEDVFFTQRFLNEFVKQAIASQQNCRAGLARNPLQDRVIMSVIYPECFLISGALQFFIIGYASGIFAAWITDARMDQQTVKTIVEGKVVDSGLHYLGCIMGHRAKVTAGVVTAPGRIIPNDSEIHLAPHLTYRGLPANHPPGSPFYVGE